MADLLEQESAIDPGCLKENEKSFLIYFPVVACTLMQVAETAQKDRQKII